MKTNSLAAASISLSSLPDTSIACAASHRSRGHPNRPQTPTTPAGKEDGNGP